MDIFAYFGSLITEDGECVTEFRTRLNRCRRSGITAENRLWKSHSIPIATKIRLMKQRRVRMRACVRENGGHYEYKQYTNDEGLTVELVCSTASVSNGHSHVGN